MSEKFFVTITGIKNYFGKKPFEINRILKLVKDKNNVFDSEAIYAELPYIGKVGYVANSTTTVYEGTSSAGRIYDHIDEYIFAKVLFITHSSVIAAVLTPDEVEKISWSEDGDYKTKIEV